jgi:hypothetical protein
MGSVPIFPKKQKSIAARSTWILEKETLVRDALF